MNPCLKQTTQQVFQASNMTQIAGTADEVRLCGVSRPVVDVHRGTLPIYKIQSNQHYLEVTADYPGFLAPISPETGTSNRVLLGSLCFQDAALTSSRTFSSRPPCVSCLAFPCVSFPQPSETCKASSGHFEQTGLQHIALQLRIFSSSTPCSHEF